MPTLRIVDGVHAVRCHFAERIAEQAVEPFMGQSAGQPVGRSAAPSVTTPVPRA
jgi:hypothetical protein